MYVILKRKAASRSSSPIRHPDAWEVHSSYSGEVSLHPTCKIQITLKRLIAEYGSNSILLLKSVPFTVAHTLEIPAQVNIV